MVGQSRDNALDHVVVVVFENRSLDNVLGRLYGPALGASLSTLGKTLAQGIREYADQNHIEIEGLPKDPKADVPSEQLLNVLRNFLATVFPLLAPAAPGPGAAI